MNLKDFLTRLKNLIEESSREAVSLGLKTGKPIPKGGTVMIEVSMDTTQRVLATLNPIDANGNPATLPSVPTWTVTNGDVTLEISGDAMSCFINSGNPGDSTVTVTSGDLSDSVITHVSGITPPPGPAVDLGLEVGTPEPKPGLLGGARRKK